MSTNSLVATPRSISTPLQGAFLLEDGESIAQAIRDEDWIAGGIAAFSTVMDGIAMASDPIGTLSAMGFGWVMEHVDPLKEWLNDLTGDAGEVQAFAQTWANVSSHLASSADELRRVVAADIADMAGDSIDAYLVAQDDVCKGLDGASSWASAISSGLQLTSTLVQMVHDMVRDALAELAGAICSYAVELTVTLGAATPLVIEQATTRAAALATRLSKHITNLLTSLRNLDGLLKQIGELLSRLKSGADAAFQGARSALSEPTVASRSTPSPKKPQFEEHVDNAAQAIRAEFPQSNVRTNREITMSTGPNVGLPREIDIIADNLLIQVKGGKAGHLQAQLQRTLETTGLQVVGFAPDIPARSVRDAFKKGFIIAATQEELIELVRRLR